MNPEWDFGNMTETGSMKIFSQYKGLGRGNFILFVGKIVTNLGAMIWPMMTLILNRKLGLDADMLPPSRTLKYKTYLGVFLCLGKARLIRQKK